MATSKEEFGKSVSLEFRKALEYANNSIMLPEDEIGSELYKTLFNEKVSEYLKSTML